MVQLILVNQSDEVAGAPSLTHYDLATGEPETVSVDEADELAPDGSAAYDVGLPSDVLAEDGALISLSLGESEASIFRTAEDYANLSPAIVPSALMAGGELAGLGGSVTPNPGNWSFEMTLGTGYLSGSSCPDGGSSGTTTGEADLIVSNDGFSAMWMIDGEVVTFNRMSASDNYQSPSYVFEVENDESVVYGTSRWTLTPASQTSIAGELHWDNSLGCTADYPISMTFDSLADPSIYALCEGTWTIVYNPIVCGSTVVDPSALPLLPYASGELDVSYAAAIPLFLSYDSVTGYQSLPNISGTNMYGTGYPNMTLGPAVLDSLGNPLVLVGGVQMTALSTTQIVGIVNVIGFGVNPCSGSGTFTMTSLSGC